MICVVDHPEPDHAPKGSQQDGVRPILHCYIVFLREVHAKSQNQTFDEMNGAKKIEPSLKDSRRKTDNQPDNSDTQMDVSRQRSCTTNTGWVHVFVHFGLRLRDAQSNTVLLTGA